MKLTVFQTAFPEWKCAHSDQSPAVAWRPERAAPCSSSECRRVPSGSGRPRPWRRRPPATWARWRSRPSCLAGPAGCTGSLGGRRRRRRRQRPRSPGRSAAFGPWSWGGASGAVGCWRGWLIWRLVCSTSRASPARAIKRGVSERSGLELRIASDFDNCTSRAFNANKKATWVLWIVLEIWLNHSQKRQLRFPI